MAKLKKSKDSNSEKNNQVWLPDYKGSVLKQLQNEESLKKLNGFSFSALWEYRPSRLFWLYSDCPDSNEEYLERSRFSQTLKKNYYDKAYLLEFFKDDPEILDVIETHKSPTSGVVFPCVLENNNNKQLPSVSFSSFIESKQDRQYSLARINNIIKENLNIETNRNFIPEISLYLELKGQSYELAFAVFLLIELYKDLFHHIPTICCTGIIKDNGETSKIRYAKEKFAAATKMGFDYIILPEENRNDVAATENTVFIQNIFELKNWILSLLHRKEQKITHWLKAGGETPTQEEFNNYFENNKSSIREWQKCLFYVPDSKAFLRLSLIAKAYYLYSSKHWDNTVTKNRLKQIQEFFPRNVYYAFAAYIIATKGYSEKICDYLNEELSEAIKTQGPDWAMAAKRLKETDFAEILSDNKLVRERYPHLLCYYFKNPSELLYILASIKELTIRENNLANSICKLINKNNNDKTLMSQAYTILNHSQERLVFESSSESITFSAQLSALYIALRKLESYQKQSLRKSVEKYAKATIHASKMLNESEKKHIINLLINNSEITETTKAICQKHALKKLLNTANTNIRPDSNLNNNIKKINHILSSIIGQPCIDFDISIIEIINNSKIYKEEMYSFIREAISYFMGRHKRKDLIFTINSFAGKELAENIGHLSNCKKLSKNYNSIFNDLWQKNNFSFRPLMWLYFLDTKSKNCILPELHSFLRNKKNQLQKKSANSNCNTQKLLCELEFIAALFGIKELCKNFESTAQKAFEGNVSLTRTEQLLIPVYLFIKKKHSISELSEIGDYLNNSILVLEIIKRFCNSTGNKDIIFIRNERLSDLEQRILTFLTIEYLHDQKDTLKMYALTCIHSFPELLIAIEGK